MTALFNSKFRNLGEILSAVGKRSHGYELHKKTGLSLRYIYEMLPALVEANLLKESEVVSNEGRKYVTLTDQGKRLLRSYHDAFFAIYRDIRYTMVLFDLDGVIFERPWNDASDEHVSVSTWDILFKKLDAYDDHERLKNKFVRKEITYSEWTEAACEVLKAKGLTKKIFDDVINQRKYNPGAKQTLKTLLKNKVTVGIITGSFFELAERVTKEISPKINIDAHCRLEFDEDGYLNLWQIMESDYEDKVHCLKYFIEYPHKPQTIAYVGDDVNDVKMFKKVGLSIAFNAIKKKVQESAEVVVDGNNLQKILPYLKCYSKNGAQITKLNP